MMALRWRVKDIAAPGRWNPHSLAVEAKIAYNTVYLIWHNQAKRADLETLEKLANVLQVEPGELIGRVPSASTPEVPE